jgi:lipopolysaccharide export LptBFGC system permease protein LptF
MRFAAIYLANLVCFTLLYVLVDSVAQYSTLSDKAENLGQFVGLWWRFYSAQLPILFCRVLSGVTLAASAAFAVTLTHRANELTPILASGISLRRLLAPVLVLSVAATGGAAAVQEVWIPSHASEIREGKALGRGRSTVRHVKHFDARQRLLVVFRRYDLKALRGEGILVLSLEGHQGNGFLLEAATARWEKEEYGPGQWIVEDGTIQEYDTGGKLVLADTPQRLLTRFDKRPLQGLVQTDMLPQDLEERESQDPYLWLGELWRQVQRSPHPARWQIRLYSRLVDPIHGLILILLGIPTILAQGSRNIFLSAIATVVLSALYFVTYAVLLNLGNRGSFSPAMAVGLAPLFFGTLGVTMFARMRS